MTTNNQTPACSGFEDASVAEEEREHVACARAAVMQIAFPFNPEWMTKRQYRHFCAEHAVDANALYDVWGGTYSNLPPVKEAK